MADVEERARKREERRRQRELDELKNKASDNNNTGKDIASGQRNHLNGDPDVSRETSEGLEEKCDAALPDVVKVPSGLNEDWERPVTPEIDEAGFAHRMYGYKSYSNAITAEGGKSGLQKKKERYANNALSGKRYDSDEDAEFEPEIQTPSRKEKKQPSQPVDDARGEDEWSNLPPQRTSEKPSDNGQSRSGKKADESEFYTNEELSQMDGRSDDIGSGGNQSRSTDWKSSSRARVVRGVNKPKSKLKKSNSWIRERPGLPEEPILKEPEWLDLVRKRRWRSTVRGRFPQTERERIQFERRLDTSKKGLKFNPRGEPTGITGPEMDDELSMYLLHQRKRIQSEDVSDPGLATSSLRSRITSDRSVDDSDYDDSLFDDNPRNREYAAEKGILNLSRPPIKGPKKEVHKNLAMERSRQSTMKWRFSVDPQEEPLWAQLPKPSDIEAINDMEGNLEAKFWSSKKKFQTGQFSPPPVLPKPRSRSASSGDVDFLSRSEEMTPSASRSAVGDMRRRLASGEFQTSTPLPPKPVELEQGYLPRLRDLQQKLADEAESAVGKAPKPNYISQEELASMGSTRRSITEESFAEKCEEPKPIEKPRMTRRRSDAELLDLLASRREEADASAVEASGEISNLASDFSKAFGEVGDGGQLGKGTADGDERKGGRTGETGVQEKPKTEGGSPKMEEAKERERKEVEKPAKHGEELDELKREQPKEVQVEEKQKQPKRKPERHVQNRTTSPEFLVNLKDCQMFVGTDTSFEVVVSGEPAPMVEWFLDDRLIRNDKRHQVVCHGAVHSLTITDIQIEDEGIYQCVATNAAGEATCDCELLVDD